MRRSLPCIIGIFIFSGLAVLFHFLVVVLSTPLARKIIAKGMEKEVWMDGFNTMVISLIVMVFLISIAFFIFEEWGRMQGSALRVVLQLALDLVILICALVYATFGLPFRNSGTLVPLWLFVYPVVLWVYLVFTTVYLLPPSTRLGMVIFNRVALFVKKSV